MESDEVLTEEESAALRDRGGDDDRPSADAGGVRHIDADHWERVFKDRIPALASITERMVSRFKFTGRKYLRRNVEVSSEPAESVRWGRFIRTLPIPASLHELEIQPFDLRGSYSLDPDFVFVIVDLFFGGDGKGSRVAESAEFTPMEARLARRFVEDLVHDMQDSWKPLVDLTFNVGRSESNPLFLSIAADSDTMSITTFVFTVGERRLELKVALPEALVEPMQFARQDRGKSADTPAWQKQIRRDVQEAQISLRAVLAETELSLRDLTQARPGDVIPIDAPETVLVKAGDQVVLEGTFGTLKERNAVRVTKPVSKRMNQQINRQYLE